MMSEKGVGRLLPGRIRFPSTCLSQSTPPGPRVLLRGTVLVSRMGSLLALNLGSSLFPESIRRRPFERIAWDRTFDVCTEYDLSRLSGHPSDDLLVELLVNNCRVSFPFFLPIPSCILLVAF